MHFLAISLRTLINWLNGNAGAIQALASLVLAAITAWYAKTTASSVRISANAEDTARKALEEASSGESVGNFRVQR